MLRELVITNLSGSVPCFGHCSDNSTLRIVRDGQPLVGAYVCPSGYVSRLVVYSDRAETTMLKELVKEVGAGKIDVQDPDIRVATRHPWDLGVSGDADLLKETYWTQSYRRTKSDDPNRIAMFLCSSCNSLFTGPLKTTGSMCNKCSSIK